jgi:hypothetical protein
MGSLERQPRSFCRTSRIVNQTALVLPGWKMIFNAAQNLSSLPMHLLTARVTTTMKMMKMDNCRANNLKKF